MSYCSIYFGTFLRARYYYNRSSGVKQTVNLKQKFSFATFIVKFPAMEPQLNFLIVGVERKLVSRREFLEVAEELPPSRV